jgi:quinol monooxygenase YgiN
VKEERTIIVVRFKVKCRPEKTEQAKAAFEAVVGPSRAVEGVISFDIGQEITDANAIIATEAFEDREALVRQESLPEVQKTMSLLDDLLAGEPEIGALGRVNGQPRLFLLRSIHPSDPWPLAGHPETMKIEPSPRLFSHQCMEG